MEWIQTIDFAILDGIQQYFRNDFLDWLFPLITSLGNSGFIWIISGLVLLLFPSTRKTGITLLLVLAVGAALGEGLIKPLVGRLRPCYVNETVQLLIPRPASFSFPSGHSWSSFAGAVILYSYQKRIGATAFLLAFLIAFSRMYLYVHFTTDVLVGGILGVLTAVLGMYCLRKFERRIKV